MHADLTLVRAARKAMVNVFWVGVCFVVATNLVLSALPPSRGFFENRKKERLCERVTVFLSSSLVIH